MKKFLSQLQRQAVPVTLSDAEMEAINTELFTFIEQASDKNDASKLQTIRTLLAASMSQLERGKMEPAQVAKTKYMIQQLNKIIVKVRQN